MSPLAQAVLVIVDFLWGLLVIGTCTYLVFWQGHSGWWYVLAVGLAGWDAPQYFRKSKD